MKQLLLILFVFTATVLKGQKLKFAQLVKLIENNEDDFNTYVIGKGFKLFKIGTDENNEDCKLQRYTHGPVTDNKAEYFITYRWCKGGMRVIEYQFSSNKQYVSLKKQIEDAGFISQDSRFGDGVKLITYKSNGLVVNLFITTNGKNALNETYTSYLIALNIGTE